MRQWSTFAAVMMVMSGVVMSTSSVWAQGMPAVPPPPEDPRMDVIVGTWHGDCEVMGMAASIELTWAWELGHQFLVSRSHDVFTLPDGQTMTAETVYYNKPQGDGTYAGTFYSSMGTIQDYTMRWEGDTLVAEWPDVGGGAGRWTGVVTPEGNLVTEAFAQPPGGELAPVFSCTYTPAAD